MATHITVLVGFREKQKFLSEFEIFPARLAILNFILRQKRSEKKSVTDQ